MDNVQSETFSYNESRRILQREDLIKIIHAYVDPLPEEDDEDGEVEEEMETSEHYETTPSDEDDRMEPEEQQENTNHMDDHGYMSLNPTAKTDKKSYHNNRTRGPICRPHITGF